MKQTAAEDAGMQGEEPGCCLPSLLPWSEASEKLGGRAVGRPALSAVEL